MLQMLSKRNGCGDTGTPQFVLASNITSPLPPTHTCAHTCAPTNPTTCTLPHTPNSTNPIKNKPSTLQLTQLAPCSRDPTERAKVAVNAQHYAILVTDVTQWPYPELQRCAAQGCWSRWIVYGCQAASNLRGHMNPLQHRRGLVLVKEAWNAGRLCRHPAPPCTTVPAHMQIL